MSAALILAKAIRFIVCSLLAAGFVNLFRLSMGGQESAGARILGGVCLSVGAVFALVAVKSFVPEHPEIDARKMEQLERHGIIVSEEYEATRAIAIEPYENGPGYLLELRDASTLCLRGFYLEEYEPQDEPGQPQPRQFPNTRFQVKTHRKSGDVWDIICLGEPFEPVLTVPAFSPEEYEVAEILEDGEIIDSPTFDDLIASKGRLPKRSGNV